MSLEKKLFLCLRVDTMEKSSETVCTIAWKVFETRLTTEKNFVTDKSWKVVIFGFESLSRPISCEAVGQVIVWLCDS